MILTKYDSKEYKDFNKKWETVDLNLIKKYGKDYKDKVSQGVNIEKYRALDELELDPIGDKSLQYWLKTNEYNNKNTIIDNVNEVRSLPFGKNNIHVPAEDMRLHDEEFMRINNISAKELNSGLYTKEYKIFLKSKVKQAMIDDKPYNSIITLKEKNPDLYNTLSHEAKHNINGNGIYLGDNYKKAIKSIFIDGKNMDTETKQMYDYFTDPSEFSSYIGTNLKDELVKQKLIKSVHDKVDVNMINEISKRNSIINHYLPFVKSKLSLVDLINKTPYAIGGVAMFNKNK